MEKLSEEKEDLTSDHTKLHSNSTLLRAEIDQLNAKCETLKLNIGEEKQFSGTVQQKLESQLKLAEQKESRIFDLESGRRLLDQVILEIIL